MGRIVTIMFFLILIGCWERSASPIKSPALRVGLHDSIDHLNVFTQSSTDFWKIQTYLFATLLRRDPVSGELAPGLAESWSWSKDKLSITFRLRENLKWSDGVALTTDDILFTLQAHEDSNYKSLYVGIFSGFLKRYKKKSDRELELHFKRPELSHLEDIGLNLVIYPRHIYKTQEEKRNRIHATSGPFKVDSFKVGQVLRLKKNPFWYGHQVDALRDLYSYPQLEFYSSGGERDLFEMMQKGKIDYFQSLDPKQFFQFSQALSKKEKVLAVKAKGYRLLGGRVISVNHRRPGLGDLVVRKALVHAFDRRMVNTKFFNQLLQIAKGPWPENHPLAGIKGVEYDFAPQKANEILDRAGWVQNKKSGIREKKINGKVHQLKFDILDYDKNNEPLLTLFKEAAREVGIKINIRLMGFSEVMRLLKEKNYDLAFHQAQWTSFNPNLRYWYFSDPGNNPYLNMGGYRDEVLDQIILKIEASFDTTERRKMYQKAYQRIAWQLPDLFLFHDRYVFYFVNKRVQRPQDVQPYLIGLPTWSI